MCKGNKMFVGRAAILLIVYLLFLLLGGLLFSALECPEELVRRPTSTLLGSENRRDKAEHCEHWSFYNSVFFAFPSITTIGYGRAAPQTQLGRGILLIYSIMGIPINSILIGTIGAFFSIKVRHIDVHRGYYENLMVYLGLSFEINDDAIVTDDSMSLFLE